MPSDATADEATGTELSVEDRFAAHFADPAPEGAEDTDEIEADDSQEDAIELEDDEEGVEEDEQVAEDEATTYTVRVSGEDEVVTLPELLAGYSRTGDYKRKTQELAEQRREAQAVRTDLDEQVAQYTAALPQLQKLIESSIGPEPDINAYTDRNEYLIAKDQWNTAKRQADAVQHEQERLQSEAMQQQEGARQQFLQHHNDQLLMKLPEWNDAAVRQREQTEVAEYLRSEGYSDEELAQLADHRAIILARKARLYDQLQAGGKAKVKGVKAKTKAAEPGTGGKVDTRGRKVRKQRERLAQTGATRDAAPLFSQLFDKTTR